eukprot:gene28404-34467_t
MCGCAIHPNCTAVERSLTPRVARRVNRAHATQPGILLSKTPIRDVFMTLPAMGYCPLSIAFKSSCCCWTSFFISAWRRATAAGSAVA